MNSLTNTIRPNRNNPIETKHYKIYHKSLGALSPQQIMSNEYERISKMEENFKFFSYKSVYYNIFVLYNNFLMEYCPAMMDKDNPKMNYVCKCRELPNPIEDIRKLNPKSFIYLYNDEGIDCSKEYCQAICESCSNHNKKDVKIPTSVKTMFDEVNPIINSKFIKKDIFNRHFKEFLKEPQLIIVEDLENNSTPNRHINQRLNAVGRI